MKLSTSQRYIHKTYLQQYCKEISNVSEIKVGNMYYVDFEKIHVILIEPIKEYMYCIVGICYVLEENKVRQAEIDFYWLPVYEI